MTGHLVPGGGGPSGRFNPDAPPPLQAEPATFDSPAVVTPANSIVTLPVGASFVLDLNGPSADPLPEWLVSIGDMRIVVQVPGAPVPAGAQSVYRAVAPGATLLTARSYFPCQDSIPACLPADQIVHLAVVATAGAGGPFPDVIKGFWARDEIALLAGAGLMRGFPDGTFRPDAPITRAEFVAVLVGVLDVPASSSPVGFSDVVSGAWYAPAVDAAAKAGILVNHGGAFLPNDPVSRQQAVVWLERAVAPISTYGRARLPVPFRDSSQIAAQDSAAVNWAVRAGFVDGLPGGTFRPRAHLTRAEAAKWFALLYIRDMPYMPPPPGA